MIRAAVTQRRDELGTYWQGLIINWLNDTEYSVKSMTERFDSQQRAFWSAFWRVYFARREEEGVWRLV